MARRSAIAEGRQVELQPSRARKRHHDGEHRGRGGAHQDAHQSAKRSRPVRARSANRSARGCSAGDEAIPPPVRDQASLQIEPGRGRPPHRRARGREEQFAEVLGAIVEISSRVNHRTNLIRISFRIPKSRRQRHAADMPQKGLASKCGGDKDAVQVFGLGYEKLLASLESVSIAILSARLVMAGILSSMEWTLRLRRAAALVFLRRHGGRRFRSRPSAVSTSAFHNYGGFGGRGR